MSYILTLYSLYLVITIILTVWVARTLFRNGKCLFWSTSFYGNNSWRPLTTVAGRFLPDWNLGYAVYTLRVTYNVGDTRQLIEELSAKTGAIILILGGMHFFNMLVFFKLRKRALVEGSQKQAS